MTPVHWAYSQMLVNPDGRHYRPAPTPDSPAAKDIERLRDDKLAAHPETLEAPAGVVALLVTLAVHGLSAALAERSSRRWQTVTAVTFVSVRVDAQVAARRRAAVRRGLTLADAPRPRATGCALPLARLAFGLGLWARDGRRPPCPSWPFWLAIRVIQELQERHAWRQAMRTSTGRAVSSDSTAASATADAA